MKVTWRQLPTVLFEDEVLDKAFSRARKAADRVVDVNRVFRTRKQLTRMVQTAADIIHTIFTETVQTWPSLDQSPQFDVAMIEACVGTDDYRHHLSMLQWGAKQVQRIASQNNRKIVRTARIELMHEARREAYGRIGSIMGRVGPSLKWLNESREILKALPQIDNSLPVIVVCGAPNVGKSAFIRALSSGNMEVNHYPFTTKQIHIGHFTHRRLQHQLVDTPGLLDRPMDERNSIELQAIAALEHVGSLVLFLIDRTETCGMPWEDQMSLLDNVERLLPGTELLVVSSKADALQPLPQDWDDIKASEERWREHGSQGEPKLPLLYDDEGRPTMSALENVGLDALRLEIVRKVKAAQVVDPLVLPEGWHRSD